MCASTLLNFVFNTFQYEMSDDNDINSALDNGIGDGWYEFCI